MTNRMKSPFLSKTRYVKLLRSSRNKKTKKSQKNKKSKTNSQEDGGSDGNLTPVQFFNSLLENDSQIISTGKINSVTKDFFAEFFKKFKAVEFQMPILKKQKKYKRSRKELFDHINPQLREGVERQMESTFKYSVHIGRPIDIIISVNSKDEGEVTKCIKMIVFWLKIVTQYTTKTTCSDKLSIYLMLSDLKKVLQSPECSSEGQCIIKKTSVNTGFSNKCSHIVIYRKEEWFKVFIHETIHNYGLDFAFMRQYEEENILKYFGITSNKFQVRLYEAYTESWARIMNALICAFNAEHDNFDRFMVLADSNIQLERLNAYFQTAKILKYMKLSMDNLADYNEETSNLSYYFIVCMLYSNYQEYILWCRNNNDGNILQFNTTTNDQQKKFLDYIKKSNESDIFRKNLDHFTKNILNNEELNPYLRTYMKKSLLNEFNILELKCLDEKK